MGFELIKSHYLNNDALKILVFMKKYRLKRRMLINLDSYHGIHGELISKSVL
jgi:hypothetical protein